MNREKLQRWYVYQAALVFIIIIGVAVAFRWGTKGDNPVNQILYPLTPTPTPDLRSKIHEEVDIGGLSLTVKEAWRVEQRNNQYDLGVLLVAFKGGKDCYEDENAGKCTFNTKNFWMVNEQNMPQTLTRYTGQYIPGLQVVSLAPTRQLIPITSEEGFIFFLLDKFSLNYTLGYSDKGDSVQFLISPSLYNRDEAIRNAKSTPQPAYGKISPTVKIEN